LPIKVSEENMAHKRYGSANDYFEAFQYLIRKGLPEKHLAMLREHYNAPDHTITWPDLAEAVGYASYTVVNRQYGRLAHHLAERLGVRGKPIAEGDRQTEDRAWWLYVLVDWNGRDENGVTRFQLLPDAVEALGRLGLGQYPTGSKGPQETQ
jgi:hypothetical protein